MYANPTSQTINRSGSILEGLKLPGTEILKNTVKNFENAEQVMEDLGIVGTGQASSMSNGYLSGIGPWVKEPDNTYRAVPDKENSSSYQLKMLDDNLLQLEVFDRNQKLIKHVQVTKENEIIDLLKMKPAG